MATKSSRSPCRVFGFVLLAILLSGCAMQDDLHIRTIVVGGGLLSAASITTGGTFVLFSPDGKTIAARSDYVYAPDERPIRIWRVSDGGLQCTIKMDPSDFTITAVCFDPSGRTLATGHWGYIKIWRVSDGALLKTLKSYCAVTDLNFSPDGRTLASCQSTGNLILWDAESGSVVRIQWPPSMVEGPFRMVKFTPDGEQLVTGVENGQIRILRASDGALVRTIGSNDLEMWSLVLARNGTTMAATYVDGSIKIWRVSDGSLLSTISTDSSKVCSVAIDATGERLAVGFRYRGWREDISAVLLDKRDYSVKLYRTGDGTLLHSLKGHKWDVTSVKFSPDGTILASGSMDMSVKLWNIRRFREGGL